MSIKRRNDGVERVLRSILKELENYLRECVKIAVFEDVNLMKKILENTFGSDRIQYHGATRDKELKEICGIEIDKKQGETIKNHFEKILKKIESENEEIQKEYFRIVLRGFDLNGYIWLSVKNEKAKKAVKVFKNRLGIDLNDKKLRDKFDDVRKVRNNLSHLNELDCVNFYKLEEINKTVNKCYEVFDVFNPCDEKNKRHLEEVCTDKQKERLKARVLEIVNSKPLSLKEIKSITPNTSESLIKAIFKDDYDEVEQFLYCYSKESVKNICSDVWKEQLNLIMSGEAINANKSYNKYFFKSLANYEKRLQNDEFPNKYIFDSELEEIILHTKIIVDISCLMDLGCLKFIKNRLCRIMERNNKKIYMEYSTRVELYLKRRNEGGQYSEDEVIKAKAAYTNISYLKEKGYIEYLNKPDLIYSKGYRGIIDLVNNNKDENFVILAKTGIEQMINSETTCNCLVLNPILNETFYVHMRSYNRLSDFVYKCYYNEDDINMEYESGKKENVNIMEKEKNKNISDDRNDISKKNNKSVKKYELPKLDTCEVEPELNEKLDCTFLPKDGDLVYFSKDRYVELKNKIGSGGEGVVYNIDSDCVAKIYKKEFLTKNRYNKLKMMVEYENEIDQVYWPIELLYNEENQFVGFTMKKVPSKLRVIGESVFKLGDDSFVEKNMPEFKKWNRRTLVEFCKEISLCFKKLHEANILMGDINQNNILVNPDNLKEFAIVDCDSFQVGQYPCPVGVPNFTSPQIFERVGDYPKFGSFLRTKSDEEYALASLLFRILMLGAVPFEGKGMDEDYLTNLKNYSFPYKSYCTSDAQTKDGPCYLIWDNTYELVRDNFADVFKNKKTISAEQWVSIFDDYLKHIDFKEYTDELKPIRYWNKKNRKYTKEITCVLCGKEANMYDDDHKRTKKLGNINLCYNCQMKANELKNQKATCKCERCQNHFEGNKLDYILQKNGCEVDCFCSSCKSEMNEQITIKCSSCKKEIQVRKINYEKIVKKFRDYKCKECLKKERNTMR